MKEFCENQYCDSPGAKVVSVSVNRPSDESRTLCVPCEEAYTIGVQHGRKVAEAAQSHQHSGPRIDKRELATILAALRVYQDGNVQAGQEITDEWIREVATDGGTLKPLNSDEVGALCERLNCSEDAQQGMVIAPPHKERPPLFRVIYTIDVNASKPVEAAEQAYEIMADPASWRPVVSILDHRGRVKRIDMSQPKASHGHKRRTSP